MPQLLEPVRHSWATGESIQWSGYTICRITSYFNHEIHVNKGIGCSTCHGRVDEMPIMYMQNSLQMEWCLNCHRNPARICGRPARSTTWRGKGLRN